MKSQTKKKDHGVDIQGAIEFIAETDEYMFLRFYDSHIDTDEYLLNFIRFISSYTLSPEKMARTFQIFIGNIKRISRIFSDPGVQFLADPSKESLLMGFFVDHERKNQPWL
jgi:hypothetical protein